MDLVHHQRFVVDDDATRDVHDHLGPLVVHHQDGRIEGDAGVEHPAPDVAGTCQHAHEGGQGLLVPRLRVAELGFRLRTGHHARQFVGAADLGHRRTDQGGLGDSHRRARVAQVHRRGGGAVDERRPAAGELRQGEPAKMSLLMTTSVPAMDIGAVAPVSAIEVSVLQAPRRALSMMSSVASRGSFSGLMVQPPKLTS